MGEQLVGVGVHLKQVPLSLLQDGEFIHLYLANLTAFNSNVLTTK